MRAKNNTQPRSKYVCIGAAELACRVCACVLCCVALFSFPFMRILSGNPDCGLNFGRFELGAGHLIIHLG